ncbi:MAG: hypothetical protein M3Z56_07535, partial [Bacteroidota bacterium]|nr:hypothetical protein [Bacteroidota bacterium]
MKKIYLLILGRLLFTPIDNSHAESIRINSGFIHRLRKIFIVGMAAMAILLTVATTLIPTAVTAQTKCVNGISVSPSATPQTYCQNVSATPLVATIVTYPGTT